jgi:RNA polymerase sigma-70 factor (ECF subfamily)
MDAAASRTNLARDFGEESTPKRPVREVAEEDRRAALEIAKAAWPGIGLAPEWFFGFVDDRRGDSRLVDLPVADLYIACACAYGDPLAIRAIEAAYLPRVRDTLERRLRDAALIDEALARMREHLFVAPHGGAPHIADYSGRGALKSWLSITATRFAFRVVRESEGQSYDLPDAADPTVDIELAYLRRRYSGEFKAALTEGFGELSTRDRNLLRLSILDELGIDPIASLYEVHRSTACRWLSRARKRLLERTRAALQRRVGVTPSHVDSLMRAVGSEIELTVERILSRPQHDDQ